MTPAERKAEIARVEVIIRTSGSPHLRRDMRKYLGRLKKEAWKNGDDMRDRRPRV